MKKHFALLLAVFLTGAFSLSYKAPPEKDTEQILKLSKASLAKTSQTVISHKTNPDLGFAELFYPSVQVPKPVWKTVENLYFTYNDSDYCGPDLKNKSPPLERLV